jgi:hypothetical protein
VELNFPQRFAAVVMHSGVEQTPATSAATAIGAIRGRYQAQIPYHGAAVPRALPALLVLQGSADPMVLKVNGDARGTSQGSAHQCAA